MTRRDLAARLRAIAVTHPSMGDVSCTATADPYRRYYRPAKRAAIFAARQQHALMQAQHLADELESGRTPDFNAAEVHNAGILSALGVTFSCEIVVDD